MLMHGERYRAAHSPSGRVDRENRVIYGVAIVEKGPVRFDARKQFVDDETLRQVLALGRGAGDGVKSHVTHPDDDVDGILQILGRFRTWRIAGEAVVADLHVSRAAKDGDYILAMAEEDPQSFGASMRVLLDRDAPRRADGFQAIRILELYAVDMVGTPALTGGLLAAEFSAKGEAPAKVTHLEAVESYLADHHGYASDGRTLRDHVEYFVDNTPGVLQPNAEAWDAIQDQSDKLQSQFESGLVVDHFAGNKTTRFGL